MRLTRCLFLLLGCSLCIAADPSRAETPKPLSVLFFGDEGHHRPADRFAQLSPVLATRGINMTYTQDLANFNPETLSKYDAVSIYANTTEISKEQEKALLDYVAGGGGFVPLHCASYCFLNSPAYIELVGAQFQRHGTGEFDTEVVDADHPITRGLEPFHTWDETYVHTKHNEKDRHVLQVRAEGSGKEPWTWTRTHGKGRVFYTAYGHDYRTWTEPGFQNLVERGIRWAANKGDVKDSQPHVAKGLKPFEFEKAEVPLYLPNAKWGTLGEPISKMQKPLDPAESARHLVLPEGFKAELFVSEPQIGKPLAMTWDHKGRLWIIETVDYPNELQPRGKGRDRISICEDTDGDGKADKFTVFAEGLSIPTSLCFANGGLVVSQAPDMLFLQDTDGDDKADVRKALFTGFGTGDTHAGPSNLKYGFDNWVYGIIGYSGYNGTVGGERHRFAQGFFRFKPDGSKLEFLRSTSNNSWGVGFSEDGLLFGSTANGCPSVYMPIANRYYESVRGYAPSVLRMISDSNRFFPVTENVRQVDHHGGFTAAAGHALYTARTYPQAYWNSTAFVTEPTGHIVATFTLQRDGTDFTSHYGWNLVGSDDEWTSPIAAEVGPDGQVWMIDWYNFIVQHNPTPEGYKTGKGAAYETDLRDKTHGRIYQIIAKDGKPSQQPKLAVDDPKGLVKALTSDNLAWRLHAQRLLVEGGKADVAADLHALVKDRSVDTIGLNPGAIHALWTLNGLGVLNEGNAEVKATLTAALQHPSGAVRRAGLMAMPRNAADMNAVVADTLLKDPDPQVRLAALIALSEMPESDKAGQSLASALAEGSINGDRWLPDAATVAAARHAKGFLSAIASQKFEKAPSNEVVGVVLRTSEHFARGGPADEVGPILASLGKSDNRVREAFLAGLSKGWPRDKTVQLDAATEKSLAELLPRISPEARSQIVGLATRWGSKGLQAYAAEIAKSFLAVAIDDSKPQAERLEAAGQLIEFRKNDAEAVKSLLGVITPRTSPEIASGLLTAIGKSEAPEAGNSLVEALGAMTPTARKVAIRSLLTRADWTASLVGGIEEGKVALTSLSLDQTQALAAHPDKAIASKAKALIAKGGGLPDADRQKVIDALSPIVMKGGDAAKGKAVFTQQCAKCHMHSGEGGKVGPELTGMAAHPKSELLIHILDPSRSVEGNFIQYTVSTTDGRVLNGLLAGETKTSVELLDAEGKKQVILREDIDELAASKKSVMPEGFEKQVPPEGIADLLQFLTQRGKYLPLDLRKVATVASDKGMFFEPEGDIERLDFVDWSPKTFEGVPFALVNPEDGRVPNAVLLHSTNGKIPPKMPKSVTLPCNMTAKAIHFLSGVSGWGYPYGREGSVSMIVRLHYADGKTEDHELKNGVHFADYIKVVDVPESKLAFKLKGQQIRYLSVIPKRNEPIETVELVKGRDDSAPVVMAITVEGND